MCIRDRVTYAPVSQSFSAIINYKQDQPLNYQEELKVETEKGEVRIKVELDCKNYIEKGKTETVEINGKMFNVISSEGTRFFVGQTYYVFYLGATT